MQALQQAIQEDREKHQGGWLALFRGNNLRRAWISGSLFAFQQTNGNQFVNSYGATFHRASGYGAATFTYTTLGQMMTVIGAAFGILLTDRVGRRPMMIGGAFMCTFFLMLGAGLGLQSNKSPATMNTIIATFILLSAFTKISASNNAFLISAEIGGVRMRKKVMAFGTGVDVLAAFLVTFTTPYLLANPGPNLGPRIGFIFGAAAFLSFLFGIFFTPELAHRSLEEVDELFEANLWAYQFKAYKTSGVGARLRQLEDHEIEAAVPMEESRQPIDGAEKAEAPKTYELHQQSPQAHNQSAGRHEQSNV